MRLITPGAAFVAAASLLAAAPSGAAAAKHPSPNGRCQITINVAPRQITAGDPVIIFGRLICPRHAQQPVRLFHHIAGRAGFSFVQRTTTDANGFYAFSRAAERVETNRSWFVRSRGAQSATRAIRVAAQVTLNGPPEGTQILTGPANAVTFTGTVDPADAGARLLLQRQNADNGNGWAHIGSGTVGPGGKYSIGHVFRVPGDANIRTLVLSQGRNIPSPSNVLQYEISQAQNPNLTINAAPDPITFGQSVVISGKAVNGAGQPLALLAHIARQGFTPVAQVTAASDGSYTFPAQMPLRSTFYEVRGAHAHSAVLFEGVKDALTAQVSGTTVASGQTLTFSGTVSPAHPGHVIYLQRQNANSGEFHVVQVSTLDSSSAYSITHRFYGAGSGNYRVFIPGGRENGGAHSQLFSITVTPAGAETLTPDPSGNSSLPASGQ